MSYIIVNEVSYFKISIYVIVNEDSCFLTFLFIYNFCHIIDDECTCIYHVINLLPVIYL